MISQSELISFLQDLIRTPSVNGQDQEQNAAKVITQFAQQNDLKTELLSLKSDRPCVLVQVGPTEETGLLLVGHIDTVPVGDESKWTFPPFGAEIKEGKLYGRGAIDNKGGIAAALTALLMLKDQALDKLDTTVTLVCVPDEESGATGRLGIKHLHETNKLSGQGAIYTYPNIDTINIGHRGLLRLKITTHGKSFHTGSLEWQNANRTQNAVTGMAEIILMLEELQFQNKNVSRYFEELKTVITPTLVSGGSGPSIVPNDCEIYVDIRLIPSTPKEIVMQEIHKAIEEIKQKRAPLQIEIIEEIYLPPTIIPDDSKVLLALKESAEEIFGINPTVTVSGPANESYLLNQFGIPTCTFGPIGAGAHAVDEYVEVDSIFQVAAVYAATALKISRA